MSSRFLKDELVEDLKLSGCCDCTDCGGPNNTTTQCFWESIHRSGSASHSSEIDDPDCLSPQYFSAQENLSDEEDNYKRHSTSTSKESSGEDHHINKNSSPRHDSSQQSLQAVLDEEKPRSRTNSRGGLIRASLRNLSSMMKKGGSSQPKPSLNSNLSETAEPEDAELRSQLKSASATDHHTSSISSTKSTNQDSSSLSIQPHGNSPTSVTASGEKKSPTKSEKKRGSKKKKKQLRKSRSSISPNDSQQFQEDSSSISQTITISLDEYEQILKEKRQLEQWLSEAVQQRSSIASTAQETRSRLGKQVQDLQVTVNALREESATKTKQVDNFKQQLQNAEEALSKQEKGHNNLISELQQKSEHLKILLSIQNKEMNALTKSHSVSPNDSRVDPTTTEVIVKHRLNKTGHEHASPEKLSHTNNENYVYRVKQGAQIKCIYPSACDVDANHYDSQSESQHTNDSAIFRRGSSCTSETTSQTAAAYSPQSIPKTSLDSTMTSSIDGQRKSPPSMQTNVYGIDEYKDGGKTPLSQATPPVSVAASPQTPQAPFVMKPLLGISPSQPNMLEGIAMPIGYAPQMHAVGRKTSYSGPVNMINHCPSQNNYMSTSNRASIHSAATGPSPFVNSSLPNGQYRLIPYRMVPPYAEIQPSLQAPNTLQYSYHANNHQPDMRSPTRLFHQPYQQQQQVKLQQLSSSDYIQNLNLFQTYVARAQENSKNSKTLKCALTLSSRWNGNGSPFLYHLNLTVVTVLPYLIDALLNEFSNNSLFLVGATAWSVYCDPPMQTEDLDFVALCSSDTIFEKLQHATRKIFEVDKAVIALQRLAAIEPLASNWQDLDDKMRSTVSNKIHEVEDRRKFDNPTSHLPLRIKRNGAGWSLQIRFRTLIDITTAETKYRNSLQHRSTSYPLSSTLATRLVYRYTSDVDPIITSTLVVLTSMSQVAPPDVLLDQLQDSLNHPQCWRLQKDVTRLRLISQGIALQGFNGTGPLYEIAIACDELLSTFDPVWHDYVFHLRRMVDHIARIGSIEQRKLRTLSRSPSQSSTSSLNYF